MSTLSFTLLYHKEDNVIVERTPSGSQQGLCSSAPLANDQLCDPGVVVWPQYPHSHSVMVTPKLTGPLVRG